MTRRISRRASKLYGLYSKDSLQHLANYQRALPARPRSASVADRPSDSDTVRVTFLVDGDLDTLDTVDADDLLTLLGAPHDIGDVANSDCRTACGVDR